MMKLVVVFISLFYVAHSLPETGDFGAICGVALLNGNVTTFIDTGRDEVYYKVGSCMENHADYGKLNCNGFWGEHVKDTCINLGDKCPTDPKENWGYCFPNNDMHFLAWVVIAIITIASLVLLYCVYGCVEQCYGRRKQRF